METATHADGSRPRTTGRHAGPEAAGRAFARVLIAVAACPASEEAPDSVAGSLGPGAFERAIASSLHLAVSRRGRSAMRTMGRILDAFGRALLSLGRKASDHGREAARAERPSVRVGGPASAEAEYFAALEAGAAAEMRDAGLEFDPLAPSCAWLADARVAAEVRASFGSRRAFGPP